MIRIARQVAPIALQQLAAALVGGLEQAARLLWVARPRTVRLRQADHAVAALDDRQLVDCGLGRELARRQRRVPVDGALLRRLMSLT